MNRIRLYRCEAIVLRRHDVSEADRILTLYTPDRGKLAAIAKGVRRISSRKSGHVELFTHVAVLLAAGRNLEVLTQAETIEPFHGIREDLIRMTYAYHVAELTDRLTVDASPLPAAFWLLRDTLRAVAEADDPALAARFFEIRLLGLLGFRPQLFSCVACGRAVEPAGNAFSPDMGGVLCPACAAAHPQAIPLGEREFRVLRFLQTREWPMARQVVLEATTRGGLERIMEAYVRHILERDLHSVTFLRGLRRVAGSPPVPTSTPLRGGVD